MFLFLAGAATLVAPPVIGLPVAATVLSTRAAAHVIAAKRAGKPAMIAGSAPITTGQQGLLTEGRPAPVTLQWHDLRCKLTDKHGQEKHIVRGVSGTARPGRLTALMGPSGSGKTSLLNALASQVPRSGKLSLSGRLTVNGQPAVDEVTHKQAYVQQEDIFYSQLTVRETLEMAAKLRLPADMSPADKAAYTDRLVSVLGLAKCLDSPVGDAKTRGISGGEKKRLSIGSELIGGPALLFLDEPTTGLDAFQAEKVMRTLKELASAGHTVISSIHQPRSSIFQLFDDLVLLSEGRCVYAGPAANAVAHFASLGHTCGPETNPAEFIADLISIDYSSKEAEAETKQRVASLADAWQHQSQQQPAAGGTAAATGPAASDAVALAGAALKPQAGPLRQLKLLFVRSWRQATRDRGANTARAISNVSSALIFGSIFFRMRRTQSSVQDRMGLLQVAAINTAMSSLVKTLNVFPRERLIVSRERAKHSYAVLPYLTAKLLAELPIGAIFPLLFGSIVYPLTGLAVSPRRIISFLGTITLESFASQALGLAVGAVAPSTEAATAIGPAVMVIWIVFGGYYANADNVRGPLKWLPHASLIKQGFQGLCINEFRGLKLEQPAGGGGYKTGDDVLKWLAFDKGSVRGAALRQARILMFYYYTTFCILRAAKPRFQRLAAPTVTTTGTAPTATLPVASKEVAVVETSSNTAKPAAAATIASGTTAA